MLTNYGRLPWGWEWMIFCFEGEAKDSRKCNGMVFGIGL
jgi:hypothetical protein